MGKLMIQIRGLKFTTKAEGPGRGWWGPPKGTHGVGAAYVALSGMEGWDGLSGRVQAELIGISKGVPDAHVKDLNFKIDDEYLNRLGAAAAWDQDKTVYLHSQKVGGSTLAHEVGHAVTKNSMEWRAYRNPELKEAYELGKSMRESQCYPLGLRGYSFSTTLEFLADSYSVKAQATAEPRGRFNTFWQNYQEAFPDFAKQIDGLF